ncbi:nicotinamidase-related amidase [Scopulibacillus daqui]|uniref:Nicotinamidase-related amidase n=1 Tax=Scopulibacillus daqui TaxID=1469162 RepID=A0ABS2Q2Q9_9BACL|nr:nicotinamidase-related amidase [Scopulibacillus daqui]
MQKLPENTALLMIDVQKGFDDPSWGERNNPDAEMNIESILNTFREPGHPVIHIQHLSKNPDSDSSGSEFKDHAKPKHGEPIFQKCVNSAFIGTDLEYYLKENAISYDSHCRPDNRPLCINNSQNGKKSWL